MRLAMMEVKIGLAAVVRRFRFKPGPNSVLHPELGLTPITTPKNKSLPIVVERRDE